MFDSNLSSIMSDAASQGPPAVPLARPTRSRTRKRSAISCAVAALVLLVSFASPAAADRSGSTTNDRIARLYFGVFGRAPDPGGEVYWNHRANDGTTLPRIAEFFVDSDEFRDRFGTGNDVVLTALYENVLGRSPDTAGFAWWQDQIANGRAISDVVINFTESDENVANSTSKPSRYDPQDTAGCDTPLDDYLRRYIERMDKTITVAVHDTNNGCSYAIGSPGTATDRLMTTASTFKLVVMGSMLLRAQDQGRSLTTTERNQLDGMVRFSDDPAVGSIAGSMGGVTTMMRTYAPRLGITNWVSDDQLWGCVAWSATSATALIEHLTIAGIGELSADSQAIALGYLTAVTPSQRWGVGDGTVGVLDATVAQKNGFARGCGAGSRINSVGMVFNRATAGAYSVAIYSEGWIDGAAASRANDQPAYVLAARNHMDHMAEHIARMMSR